MAITKTLDFLPAVFQSETNSKFLGATLDQLMTEPNVATINGYVGRKFTPGWEGITSYIREPNKERADYQLEPTIVVKNNTTSEVDFYGTYPDLLAQINYFGGNTTNQNKLFHNEYYNYNPQLNLDELVNFGKYFWIPNGPDSVDVFSGTASTSKTFYVYPDDAAAVYTVSGYTNVGNPDIVLVRGGIYEFVVNQSGKSFYIQTEPGLNVSADKRLVLGVANNGDDVGTVTFTVPLSTAQDTFINMPIVQNVDFVTNLKFSEIDGIALSVIAEAGGLDSVDASTLVSGKSLIFSTDSTTLADWTSSNQPGGVASIDRWKVWNITLTPSGSDYIVTLTATAAVPTNNKVIILSGVTNSGTQWYKNGTGYFTEIAPITAPLDTLYYQDSIADTEYGIIRLIDSTTNVINITTDIVGKQNYISPNGVIFTNGLKVKFDATVIPTSYRNTEYYVEGVGTGIQLVKSSNLTVSAFISRANFDPVEGFTATTTSVALNDTRNVLTITANADPASTNIDVGTFPNSINSNYISAQELTFKFPYRGGLSIEGDGTSNLLREGALGVSLTGVPFYSPSNGQYVVGTSGILWHYNTTEVLVNGQDVYGGFPDDNEIYHYHDSNFITQDAWANIPGFTTGYVGSDGHSKLIGFAADGYPIYGPYGYTNAVDSSSGTALVTTSYTVSSGTSGRPEAREIVISANTINGANLTVSSTFGLNPGMRLTFSSNSTIDASGSYRIVASGGSSVIGSSTEYAGGSNQIQLNADIEIYANTSIRFEYLAGAFIEDYSYQEGLGSLDRYNGRYCVTPEYPTGTYAYFAPQDVLGNALYPYFVGTSFYGSLDPAEDTSLLDPDYIVVNRASRDQNPWTRRNRWFHEEVLAATGIYNNTTVAYDTYQRAARPIIDFNADLELYDFGTTALAPVDIFDTQQTRPFIGVEGVIGIFLDGINVINGMRIIFASAEDTDVAKNIYRVSFVDTDGIASTPNVIHLTLEETASVNDTLSVLNGQTNVGKSFWCTGVEWNEGQTKTSLNQSPLFNIYDNDGVSLSDTTVYPVSNNLTAFNGTKIFSYTLGTGANDTVLGFPLTYQSIGTQGDIEFTNNYDFDTFTYKSGTVDVTQKVNLGFLRKNNADGTYADLNVWETVLEETKQYQVIGYDYDGLNNDFRIDVTPAANTATRNLQVFVNYKKIKDTEYQIISLPQTYRSISIRPNLIKADDRIDILVYSDEVSKLGNYQVPDNLNLNAENTVVSAVTLGEFRNHLGMMTRTSTRFAGVYPGTSNIRDIVITSSKGSILQQSSPITYASIFLGSDTYNFVSAIYNAQQEYTRFKNKFLTIAAQSNQINTANPRTATDLILKQINQVKNKTFPWYYSDMVPSGDNKNTINYNIFNPAQKQYEITTTFTISTPSNTAVLVYLNNSQLTVGSDYTFLASGPAIVLTNSLTINVNDILTIIEYSNTDGSYIPETPSKLGLYPKYKPALVTDSTYSTTTTFVVGHDGSKTPIFNDFRDDLLLELELRIYNNIKVYYNEDYLSIFDSKPGKFRDTGYTSAEYNKVLSESFLKWIGFNKVNYVSNTVFSSADPFTWNYGLAFDGDNAELQGSWRACYEYFYDTQTPHLTPWEMLGFIEEPLWWQDRYGPAPYTSGNSILWDDLEAGLIANGDRQGTDLRFARIGLSAVIPVDEYGVLRPPVGTLTNKYNAADFERNWSVGQWGPAETAWRNNSEWPFAQQIVMAITHPGKYFGLGINTNAYSRNAAVNQYLVADTNYRLTQSDVMINGRTNTAGSIQRAAGYINWINDLQVSNGVLSSDELYRYLTEYTVQLSYRMAGFSDKTFLKVLAEQASPNSINESVIIPDQDFDLILGKSAPIRNISYSAVIIKKTDGGYEISGYDSFNPSFIIVAPNVDSTKSDNITVINDSVEYYTTFNRFTLSVPYGTVFTTLQQVANLLSGYEQYLTLQGFTFNYFDEQLGKIKNWRLSTEEFLFWKQQKWAVNSSIVLSPFSNRGQVNVSNVFVDGIQNSFFGTKITDQNFTILGNDAYSVVRAPGEFSVSIDSANSLIGYLELNLVQYEHVLIFNNTTQFNDIIYSPQSGNRQFRLKLIGQKTEGWDGSLSAQGFIYNNDLVPAWVASTDYLRGDLVEYKNFYYSAIANIVGSATFDFTKWLPVNKNNIKTGLLNNFATQANLGKDFYDIDKVNIESQADLLGFGLIGFRPRNYLYNAGIDDSSQVKFYQGFIKQKGTRNAINALGTVSFNNEENQVEVNEYWALRVGEYGSLSTNQFVELVLSEDYTLNNPTSLLVNSNNAVTYSSLYNYSQGVYNSEADPFIAPFLLNRSNSSVVTDDVKTAGFTNLEDVDYTVFDLSDISTFTGNVQTVGTGETIWTAKSYDLDWDVLYVTGLRCSATEIVNALNGRININTDVDHKLSVGDTIVMQSGTAGTTTTGLVSAEYFVGFYRVLSVQGPYSFTCDFPGNLNGFSRILVIAPIYKLESLRKDRASEIVDFTPPDGWTANSKVWVNYETTDTWGVYNKSEPFVANTVFQQGRVYASGASGAALKISTDSNFVLVGVPGQNQIVNYQKNDSNRLVEGKTIASRAPDSVDFGSVIDSGDNIIAVGSPLSGANGEGYVHIFQRDFTGELTLIQLLSATDGNVTSFGNSIAMSSDYQWLYIGAPDSDIVLTYAWDGSVDAITDTFTAPNANVATFTLSTIETTHPELILVSNSSVDFAPYRDYTITGDQLTFTTNAQPDTYVVRLQSGFRNISEGTFVGNADTAFGRSVACSTDGAQIVIGAPLETVNGKLNAGSVTVYDRSVEQYIAFADQTLFGGIRSISYMNKIYVNGVLQIFDIDYTILFSTWVALTEAPDAGSTVIIQSNAFNLLQYITAPAAIAEAQYGYSVDLCTYNCSLYAGSPYYSKNESLGKFFTGAVYVQLNQGRIYGTITGAVQNPTVNSGDSIRLNDFEVAFTDTTLSGVVDAINAAGIPGITATTSDNYLVINGDSTISADKLRVLPGVGTSLADLGLTVFAYTQTIENPTNFANDLFGQTVKIDETSNKLAVASDVAITVMDTTFDLTTSETTLDADSTGFVDEIASGAVWLLGLLSDSRNTIDNPSKFAYVQQLKPSNINVPGLAFVEGMKFGSAIDLLNGRLFVGAEGADVTAPDSGIVVQYNNPNLLNGWDLYREEGNRVDVNGILKAYVYSEDAQTILYTLDYIDPVKGKILGAAEQDITFKVDYDPASYNNGNIDTVAIDTKYFWNTSQIGQVWWDLSTVRYVDYEQGSISYRTNNWGKTFPGSSIDVYEWIESNYLPSQYVANGGDGLPKYTNNEAYVTLGYVDPRTNQTTVKYYYWVKDKTNLAANQFGRTIPTITIANYIRTPKSSGVKYFAAIRDDAVSVYNLEKNVVGNDTIFHMDYATKLNSNIIHSEFALVSETGTTPATIPTKIYNKIIDSLSGIDASGNSVPDPTLPVQRRYGINLRPRQGVFINSSLAFKELITYVNAIFAENLIGQGYDLSLLEDGEPIPVQSTGTWDSEVATFEILTFINVNTVNPGYRVLVDVDETVDNLWTIYTLQADRTWKLIRVQTFRPTDYWQYIDWYATGVTDDTVPEYTVATLAAVSAITTLRTGDIVKVLNNGQNKWVLVQVFANVVNTVGLEDGTIQLLDSLWDIQAYGMSYDNDLFDTERFDQNPSLETRKILESLKTNIFINELKFNFVEMFFTQIYYVLTEQKSVDWLFKTSLIDVIQKIDGLTQPQIYARDSQDIYKNYIEEVKPYHTTIREYITDYIGNDNWNGYTSDFDLPAYYDPVLQQYRSPSGEFAQDATALQRLEYRDWLLSYPYSITEIRVVDGGSGYTTAPNVTITGSTLTNDAVAIARVTGGIVTRISLLYTGTNYVTQPTITISGGSGTGARAYAVLGNNPIRKIKTTLVYDRLTYGTTVLEWAANTAYLQGDIITFGNIAYQAVRDFSAGATFIGNDLTEYDAAKFENANDRIQSYYTPEVGLPGKNFGLLQYGIDYPGVAVQGPLFTEGGGFDSGPYDISAFDSLSVDEDGTYIISEAILDSKIESLYTDSSLGLRPEDIIVDGDNYISNQVLEWTASTYYPQGTVLKSGGAYYIANVGVTTGAEFGTTDLMNYPLNPYTAFSSHSPEELIPGRVYDTLDITVSTFATDASLAAYATWVGTTAFDIGAIIIADGGAGYDSNVANITVTISGSTGTGATASVASVDANGAIIAISVISAGTTYTTIPNVVITGSNTSTATATVILTQNDYDTFEYRIFKDMNDNYSYHRINPTLHGTTLAENVTITSNTIVVANSQVLSNPAPYGTVPGVIYVNGERITYWTKNDGTNTLSNIRRGTLGTGANTHVINSTVYDASTAQKVPYSDNYTVTNLSGTVITTSGGGYTYDADVTYIRSNLWQNGGFQPTAIIIEEVIANTAANIVTTESNIGISTEGGPTGGTPSPTDGSGLYNSTLVQAIFVRDEI